MKRITIALFLLVSAAAPVAAQELTIEECQRLAQANYPLISQYDLIVRSSEYTLSNARRNWLPQVAVSAQAMYQSETLALPRTITDIVNDLADRLDELGIEGIPNLHMDGLPKDTYKAEVEIRQVVWDGGLIKAQTDAAKAERDVSLGNLDVEMYALRERVNGIFFGMLLLQENMRQTDILISELERNYRQVEAYVANGVAGRDDLDLLQVEILSAQQQRSALTAARKSYSKMLGIMIGKELSPETKLVLPAVGNVPSAEIYGNRPEMKLLDAQDNLLDAQRKGLDAGVMPQIGIFAQGAYANTGLNAFEDMRENKWGTYGIVGVSMKWNISAFYTRRNRMSQININRSLIESQRESLIYNLKLKSAQETSAIENYTETMRNDDEIIRLREAIRRRTESRLRNGTATVNDLLRDMASENAARRNKAVHEIELLKAIYNLKHTVNN